MTAPNGRPSLLSEEDWRLVRTPAFKEFFGDWEDDPAHASKVLDANGEPLAVWHGSTNRFTRFDLSRGGDTTGLTEYTDRRTGETVVSDSAHAAFLTSRKETATSYCLLAQFHAKDGQLRALETLLPMVERLGGFTAGLRLKTRDDFDRAVATAADRVPSLRSLLDESLAHPGRKVMGPGGILPSMPEADRAELARAMREGADRAREEVRRMSHGGLANMVDNCIEQAAWAEVLKASLHRLRTNDLDTPNMFGTFREYNMTLTGGTGDAEMFVSGDGGTVRVSYQCGDGTWKRLHMAETDDRGLQELAGEIDRITRGALALTNGTLSSMGYAGDAHLYRCFVNLRNPLEHDYEGSSFPDAYKGGRWPTAYVAARQVRRAKADGNDGVTYRRVRDPFLADTYGVFDAGQILIAGVTDGITVSRADCERRLREILAERPEVPDPALAPMPEAKERRREEEKKGMRPGPRR